MQGLLHGSCARALQTAFLLMFALFLVSITKNNRTRLAGACCHWVKRRCAGRIAGCSPPSFLHCLPTLVHLNGSPRAHTTSRTSPNSRRRRRRRQTGECSIHRQTLSTRYKKRCHHHQSVNMCRADESLLDTSVSNMRA